MLANTEQKKRRTRSVKRSVMDRRYPFSFTFDTDSAKTKLDLIIRDSMEEIEASNIVMAKMVITFLFKESRKTKLPFVQSGKMSILDSNGILAEKEVSGLMRGIRFDLTPNVELIQKLIISENTRDEDLIFSYEFRSYDVWEKESVNFSAREPIFFKIKQALNETTQYYFIGNDEPRLLKFVPKSLNVKKKSLPDEQIIVYSDSPRVKRDRPNTASIVSNALVASSVVQPNLSLATFSILPYFNTNHRIKVPKVDSKNDNYWVDYYHKDLYWVKPDHELLLPNRGMSYETSPFQFTVRNIGISEDGSPALEADMIVTVRRYLNKNWISSLGKKKKTRLLNTTKPTYRIQLPYIDGTGKQKHAYLDVSTVNIKKKYIKLGFTVSNDWVRLLYGALSTPGLPNASRPTLILSYYFNAMLKKRNNTSYLVSGLQLGHSIQLNKLNRFRFNREKGTLAKNTSSKKSIRRTPKPSVAIANNSSMLATHTPTVAAVSNINWDITAIDRFKKKEYARQAVRLTPKLDLKLECTFYGDYFTELKNDENVAIGCSEPMRIGQIKTPLFLKIDALDHAKYEVYKSQVMPQMFVVVPKSYAIARRLEEPDKFAPELFLHGAVDIENLTDSRCVVDLKLQPNITYYEGRQLENALKKFTAYPAQIAYITEFVGEESVNWNLSNSIIEKANTFTFDHTINTTLETGIMNAQLCKSMLERGGITGIYKKKLDTDLEVSTQMVVTLDTIAQPWSGEGLRIENKANALHLTNELESIIHVDRLVKIEEADEEEVPVQQNVVSGQTLVLEGDFDGDEYIPVFSIETDQQALSENYTYIEDLFQQIICFDLFSSSENGNLLEVHVGIQNQPPYTKIDFSDGAREQESTLLIPISEIISSVLFGYFIKYRAADGTIYESNWIHHNFSAIGNIINITSNTIT